MFSHTETLWCVCMSSIQHRTTQALCACRTHATALMSGARSHTNSYSEWLRARIVGGIQLALDKWLTSDCYSFVLAGALMRLLGIICCTLVAIYFISKVTHKIMQLYCTRLTEAFQARFKHFYFTDKTTFGTCTVSTSSRKFYSHWVVNMVRKTKSCDCWSKNSSFFQQHVSSLYYRER